MRICHCMYILHSHQNAKGYYRVSAYFFSKVFCDLLPMRFLPVIAFSAISYWMLGQCLVINVLVTSYICVHRSQKWPSQIWHLCTNVIADIVHCCGDSVLHQCCNKCVCTGQPVCCYVICRPNGNTNNKHYKIILALLFFISRYLVDFL